MIKFRKGVLVWGNKFLKPEYRNIGMEPYYFGVSFLSKKDRADLISIGTKPLSFYKMWYDGPHAQLNLYFMCFYWSTQWTSSKGCER